MTGLVHRQDQLPLPDELFELTEGYQEILALLEGPAAMRRIVATVPTVCGADTAWVGEPEGPDEIVLRHPLNLRTDMVDGLVVPVGCGLGGQVLVERTPKWVRDYQRAQSITHHFKSVVEAEGMTSMIAVPMVYEDRLLGVLYGSNRSAASYDDRATQLFEQAAARAAAAVVVAERARHAAEIAVHEERRRVALDLHDTVGAMLFTIGAGIRRLAEELPPGDALQGRLSELEQQTAEAAAALRTSLHALNVPPDHIAGCVALRGDCRAFQERTGIIARLITVTDVPPLPSAHVRALVAAAREALLNVEKHAQAQSVVVSVFAGAGGVTVRIADDGVGLPTAGNTSEGLGMQAMSERLARVGGRLSVGRNEDGGVTVQAWVPA